MRWNAFYIVLLAVLATGVTLLVLGIMDLSHAAEHGEGSDDSGNGNGESLSRGTAAGVLPTGTHPLLTGASPSMMEGCSSQLPTAMLADLAAVQRQQYSCQEAAAWLANVRLLDSKYPGILQPDGSLNVAFSNDFSSTSCAPLAALEAYRETCFSEVQTVLYSRLF